MIILPPTSDPCDLDVESVFAQPTWGSSIASLFPLLCLDIVVFRCQRLEVDKGRAVCQSF